MNEESIKNQQELLKALGYYHGSVDGIWGPKTIQAKKEFESTKNFNPGIPNNGLPFKLDGPFPKGIYLLNNKLSCLKMEEEERSSKNRKKKIEE